MKIFIIVLIVFVTFEAMAVCQATRDSVLSVNYKKNVVYGTFGLYPGATYNLNYERQIIHLVKCSVSSINIRLGYGVYGDLAGSEKLFLLSSNFIFGQGSSHFETDLGAAYLFDIVRMNSENENGVIPVINAGYRFQKKNGHFVFRTGIGWPDCIYMSLGFAM
ncbi:MAG: hypothetical protein A2V64_12370 [Bacteroidetes bacterium RBG_13_43_22]|nr:MAG: hypothetical protein A2V64_12370 [Bacteroidetes bacterium RBG_13_43_22]